MIIVKLERNSIACPSQWVGELSDGRQIYIRFRHGTLTVGAGKTLEEAVDFSGTPMGVLSTDIEGKDGFLTDYEMESYLSEHTAIRFAHHVVKHPCDCVPDELIHGSCMTCGQLPSEYAKRIQEENFEAQMNMLKRMNGERQNKKGSV